MDLTHSSNSKRLRLMGVRNGQIVRNLFSVFMRVCDGDDPMARLFRAD